ncbi:MAG: VIT1/CCC1 transporter family protein [Marinoscillum sp.]
MDNMDSNIEININMNIDEIIEHIEKEHANKAAHNIKSFTYGGVDGVITTFAIMAAAVGANLDPKIVIIMGFAKFCEILWISEF